MVVMITRSRFGPYLYYGGIHRAAREAYATQTPIGGLALIVLTLSLMIA